MTSQKRRALSLFLTAGAAIGIAGYLYIERDRFLAISLVRPYFLVLAIALSLMSLHVNNAINYFSLRYLDVQIGFLEALALTIMASVGNLLGPLRSGAIMRATYLKLVHGFELSRFVSTLYGLTLVTAWSASSIALATTLYIQMTQVDLTLTPLILFLSVVVTASLLAVGLPRLQHRGSRIWGWLTRVSEGVQALRRTRRAIVLGALGLTQAAIGIVTLWVSFSALGVNLAIPETILIGALGSLSTLVSLTPGNLGVYEAVVASTSRAVDIDPVLGVAAALISRIAFLSVLLPGGFWAGPLLAKRLHPYLQK